MCLIDLNERMTLSGKDLKAINALIGLTFDEKLDAATENTLATKQDVSYLPTKNDFYKMMDEIMGEIKGMGEDFAVISGKVYDDHEPRIMKIEKKLRIQPSS
jgi:hypothetical protein